MTWFTGLACTGTLPEPSGRPTQVLGPRGLETAYDPLPVSEQGVPRERADPATRTTQGSSRARLDSAPPIRPGSLLSGEAARAAFLGFAPALAGCPTSYPDTIQRSRRNSLCTIR